MGGRAPAGGGAALGAGGVRWLETPGGARGDGADGPRAMAYIGVGAAICSRRLRGQPRGGRDRGGRGAGLFSPGATSENVLQRPRQVLERPCPGCSRPPPPPRPCSLGGMAFLGLVRLPSELASMGLGPRPRAPPSSLMPYCGGGRRAARAGLDPSARPGRRLTGRGHSSGPRPALLRPRSPGDPGGVVARPHGAQRSSVLT